MQEPRASDQLWDRFDSIAGFLSKPLARATPLLRPTNPKKILVVVDNDIDQLRAAVMLHDFGTRVEVIDSSRRAIAYLEKSDDVQLVFIDCDMSDMDGIAAVRLWRSIENRRRAAIPIVGLSWNGPDDYLACLAAGMNDCLPKPVRRSDVARCLTRWLPNKAPTSPRAHRTEVHEH